MVLVTKGKFLNKQRMKFRRKWAEYDTTSSSNSSNSDEDEDDQENEDKNTGEEEEGPAQAGQKLIEEANEMGDEGNEEDEEDENREKPDDCSEQEVEEEKVKRAWYHWSNERGPTANQDYQREIEDRGLNFLLGTLEAGGDPGKHGDSVSYQHGGVYGRLEQVRAVNCLLALQLLGCVLLGLERVPRSLQDNGN